MFPSPSLSEPDPGSETSRPSAGILHADLDAFYASVHQRDRPELRNRPVIVGGGVVLAASYEARRFGVRSAMGGAEARRRCPHAIVVEPTMEAYVEASRAVFAIFHDTTPVVEPLSIDEAFLDVSGLWRTVGSPTHIAEQLRQRVAAEVGLALTVGVARTKFLAKVASGVGKPDGLLVVEPEREDEFLHPLGVARLWGVGPKTEAKLAAKGITTVGEVAAMDLDTLVAICGSGTGNKLHALAHNRDPRRVEGHKRRSSIGSQQALGRRRLGPDELGVVLLGIVSRVAFRLREGRRVTRTVVLRWRDDDYRTHTRSNTLPQATNRTDHLTSVAHRLLHDVASDIDERGCTLLGLTLANLCPDDAVQLSFVFANEDGYFRDATARDDAIDDLKARFGHGVIRSASELRAPTHHAVPLLPDPG